MNDEIRIPDIEVIIGAAGSDVAIFCFYKRDDIHQGYEIVSGVAFADAGGALRQILQDCLTTLNSSDWHTVDVLRADASEETADAPF